MLSSSDPNLATVFHLAPLSIACFLPGHAAENVAAAVEAAASTAVISPRRPTMVRASITAGVETHRPSLPVIPQYITGTTENLRRPPAGALWYSIYMNTNPLRTVPVGDQSVVCVLRYFTVATKDNSSEQLLAEVWEPK